MPVFAYEFAEGDPNTPINVELVGPYNEAGVEYMRMLLMQAVVLENTYVDEDDSRRNVKALADTPDELIEHIDSVRAKIQAIKDADPKHLPMDIMRPILYNAVESSDTRFVTIDKVKGVALFEIRPDEMSYSGEAIKSELDWLSDISDSKEFMIQAIRHDCNYLGYAVQPTPGESKEYEEHYSLGYADQNEVFTPFVTVLNPSYYKSSAE